MHYLLEEKPHYNWHHGMMNNMKSGHLSIFVSHNHEEGVHEVCELGEEVPPHSGRHVHSVTGGGVVHRLTHPVVFTRQPELAQTGEYPQTEQGLEEVVGKHQFLNIKSWFSLHVSWSSKSDHVVVEETQSNSWPGRGHQHPVINPKMISNNKQVGE